MQRLAEVGRIDGDEIERNGGQHHHEHAEQDRPEIGEHGGVDLARGRMHLARQEFRRLAERAAQHEDQRHNQTSDDEGNAPAPGRDLGRRQGLVDRVADQRAEQHRQLLARRLKRGDEAFRGRRRDFGEIDRDAAELDPGREALQQPSDDDDDRRRHADLSIGRREGDDDGADGHDRQRDDETLPASEPVDIRAEINRPQRPHQRAEPEHDEGGGGVEELAAAMEERLADRRRIEAEQEEIVHFEEVTARRAQHRAELGLRRGGRQRNGGGRHGRFSPVVREMTRRGQFGKRGAGRLLLVRGNGAPAVALRRRAATLSK